MLHHAVVEETHRSLRVTLWSLGGVAAFLAAANIILLVLGRDVLRAGSAALFVALASLFAGVAYAGIGSLIAGKARQLIGWVMVGTGLCYLLLSLGADYAIVGFRVSPGSLPFPEQVGAILVRLQIPAVCSLPLLMLLFPTGRPPSARWRWVMWLGGAGLVVTYVGFLLRSVPVEVAPGITYRNPFALEGAQDVVGPLLVAGAWALAVASVACFVALFRRFRRGDRELRQQIKWLGLVAAAGIACLVIALASLVACGCDASPVASVAIVVLVFLEVVGIPAAIAIAVFRYHLYDLDLVVSKALVYAILAAAFTGIYVAIVLGVGAFVGDRGNSFLTTVAAVVIAIAF